MFLPLACLVRCCAAYARVRLRTDVESMLQDHDRVARLMLRAHFLLLVHTVNFPRVSLLFDDFPVSWALVQARGPPRFGLLQSFAMGRSRGTSAVDFIAGFRSMTANVVSVFTPLGLKHCTGTALSRFGKRASCLPFRLIADVGFRALFAEDVSVTSAATSQASPAWARRVSGKLWFGPLSL